MTPGPFADQIDFLDPPLHQALPVKVDGSKKLRPKLGHVKVFLMRRLRHLTRGDDRTLTVREREVMRLAAEGFTNRAIAHELEITEATIKLHLHNIYWSAASSSASAAACLAMTP